MIPVQRLEIIVDAPHSARITEVLQRHGLTGWSIVPNVTGVGERGARLGDELTGVSSNHLILTTCSEAALGPLIEDLRALLVRAGGMCLISEARWLRH